ncbi:hypothetical protein P8452_75941 [Trifolium repens]|nr:hypothetical protein P8452_75941 [Trifolium repens]
MASSTNSDISLLMVCLWHHGHRYIELHGETEFYCNLCQYISTNVSGLVQHLKGTDHKDQFHLAKKRVLGKQRFLFHDFVYLFDYSEVMSKPFHTVLDRTGGAYATYFKQLPEDQLIERLYDFPSRNVRTIVHGADLNIQHFNYYEYLKPIIDKYFVMIGFLCRGSSDHKNQKNQGTLHIRIIKIKHKMATKSRLQAKTIK